VDAFFGLISLTTEPLAALCAPAREAFAAGEQGRVTHWSDDGLWLVCSARRSRGDAPGSDDQVARSPSGRYQVAVAGALHYRTDLARQLDGGSRAAVVDGISDAALAALAWEKWQSDAPMHIEGEFCLAVADLRDRSATLVQSRIEYAPLYCVETSSWFGFSTRLLPLTRLPGVGRTLDVTGFARAVSRYQVQANDPHRTCVRGIEQVPAAAARLRGRSARRDWDYWTPDADGVTSYRSEAEVHLEVRERLRAAIAERVRQEPVVACLLSGGLDSSSVACLASRETNGGRAVVGVSAVLADGDEADEPDERPYIECAQRHASLDVTLVTPAGDVNPWRIPERFFQACESPALSPRHYLYDALFAAAAGRCAGLVLDGGYGELGASFAPRTPVTSLLRRGGVSRVGAAVRAFGRGLIARSHDPAGHTSLPAAPAYAPWLNAAVREDVLRDCGLATEMADASGPEVWRHDRDPGARIGYPPLWRKVARSHIAGRPWNIEVTFPFRDPRLWQYCAGLPSGLAFRRGYARYLLRAAMDGFLPREIQWRTTKSAFSSDYYARMRRSLEWARRLCASVTPSETAAQLIDLPWLRSTLAAIAPDDLRHSNINRVFLLQGTAGAIQYLRWFDGTGQSEP
jgi:asparagine synthase (glutamine-hydrolysing)